MKNSYYIVWDGILNLYLIQDENNPYMHSVESFDNYHDAFNKCKELNK